MSLQNLPPPKDIFAKAVEAITVAEYDFKGGFYGATANRAYYAGYYCMMALLYTQNSYAKTHNGTKTKFGELFIKTGIFPITISKLVDKLFEYRQAADYDISSAITAAEAKGLIEDAKEVYATTYAYFQSLPE